MSFIDSGNDNNNNSFFRPRERNMAVNNPLQCSECKGMLLYGTPLHCCNSKYGCEPAVDLYWCITCSEYLSSAMWDDETQGPYPFTVTCNVEGHA